MTVLYLDQCYNEGKKTALYLLNKIHRRSSHYAVYTRG